MSEAAGLAGPSTWFLPAERAAPDALAREIVEATTHPIVDAMLRTWGGAVAVLNAQRQIVALNATYLEAVGAADAGVVLGLRPGEAIGCTQANAHPGGCGTARACAACGAAVAIVSSAARDRPEERDCVLSLRRDDATVEIDLRVRAAPLTLDGITFTLVTLSDVTVERRRAALERAFFHDLANLVAGLTGAAASLDDPDPAEVALVAGDVRSLTARLSKEVQLQRALASARPGALRLEVERLDLGALLDQMRKLFQHHPVAAGKRLAVAAPLGLLALDTDGYLLHRVVTNMLVNAFEATPPGGEVRLTVTEPEGRVALSAWNPGAIPPAIAPRIFQRYFSTKPGEGRGQGTFVMKLFGEAYLKGRMTFTTGPLDGTCFTLTLPRSIGAPAALAAPVGPLA